MNIRFAVLSSLIAMTLASCASTTPQYTGSRMKRVVIETDMAYVNDVEAAARRRNVGVVWVHPPRKIVPATNGP